MHACRIILFFIRALSHRKWKHTLILSSHSPYMAIVHTKCDTTRIMTKANGDIDYVPNVPGDDLKRTQILTF